MTVWAYCRAMRQLGKLEITLPDLGVLCALIICSPDREQLSEVGKEKLTIINNRLVMVSNAVFQ